MKVRKTYTSFYNGISQQTDELILDTQCKDMVNCVPSIVQGLMRRNGLRHVAKKVGLLSNSIIHNYDRGLYGESYLFIKNDDITNPLAIFDKKGIEKSVIYENQTVKDYLNIGLKNYRAITVQDTTFLVNRDARTGYIQDVRDEANYAQIAYLWAKRSSNDFNNQYTYGIYVNGKRCWTSHHKADIALVRLKQLIDGTVTPNTALTEWVTGYTGSGDDTLIAFGGVAGDANKQDVIFLTEGKDVGFPTGLSVTVKGTVMKITSTTDFTFTSWDSWGNQASKGWKGSIDKITDLPSDIEYSDVYVRITNDDKKNTDYYVFYNGSSWEETRDPADVRSYFINMPVKITRGATGSFKVSEISWDLPLCGNTENNPTPSFIGKSIQDIFFFKNRLGFVADDSIVLSETANYYNFYSLTVLEVLDTDVIDVAIASKQANLIKFALPFKDSVFLFCEDSQYELKSTGALSPLTVNIGYVGSFNTGEAYPTTLGDSMFFISSDSSSYKVREFLKVEDTLSLQGQDITLAVPTLLPKITKMVSSSTADMVFCLSKSDAKTIFVYHRKLNNKETVQSAWFRWKFSVEIDDIIVIDNRLYVVYYHNGYSFLANIDLSINNYNDKVDEIDKNSYTPYDSYIDLPTWYPTDTSSRVTTEPIIVQKATITGSGKWDVDIYREDYNTTITKSAGLTGDGYIIPSSVADNDVYINSRNFKYRLRFRESASLGTMYEFKEQHIRNTLAFKHPTLDAGYVYEFDEEGRLIDTTKVGIDTIPEQEEWTFSGVFSGTGDTSSSTSSSVTTSEIKSISNVALGRDLAMEAQYNGDLSALNAGGVAVPVKKYWNRLTRINTMGGGQTIWTDHLGSQQRDDRWGKWVSSSNIGTIVATTSGTGSDDPEVVYNMVWNSPTSSYEISGGSYSIFTYTTVMEVPKDTATVAYLQIFNLANSPQKAAVQALGLEVPNHGLTYKYDATGKLLKVDVWNETVYGQANVRTVDITSKVGSYYIPSYTYTISGLVKTSQNIAPGLTTNYYCISFQGNGSGESIWYDGLGNNITQYIQPQLVGGKAVYDPNGNYIHKWGSGTVGAWNRYPAYETNTPVDVVKYVAYDNTLELTKKLLIGKYYVSATASAGGKTEHYDGVVVNYSPATGTTYDFTDAVLVREDEWGDQSDLIFSSYIQQAVSYVLNYSFSSKEYPIIYNNQFKITAITLEGLYRPRTRGMK